MCKILITKTYIEFHNRKKGEVIKGNYLIEKSEFENQRKKIKQETPDCKIVYFDYEEI